MFVENLTPFFNVGEHATLGIWLQQGAGSPVNVYGIFENEDSDASIGRVDIEGNSPRFLCRLADIPLVKFGDTLTINGVVYNVQGGLKDGTGVINITLREP